MQTLLDTNTQLNPHTRHAQGLPVHCGFSDYKAGDSLFGGEDASGKDVVEWLIMNASVFITCFPTKESDQLTRTNNYIHINSKKRLPSFSSFADIL